MRVAPADPFSRDVTAQTPVIVAVLARGAWAGRHVLAARSLPVRVWPAGSEDAKGAQLQREEDALGLTLVNKTRRHSIAV